jgi:hypothetical protein
MTRAMVGGVDSLSAVRGDAGAVVLKADFWEEDPDMPPA